MTVASTFPAALVLCASSTVAIAQDGASGGASPQTPQAQNGATPPTAAAPSTSSLQEPTSPSQDPAAAMVQEAMKFAKFDTLKAQGQTTDLPGTYDTILGDSGGMRSWLYDHDIWFRAQSVNSMATDVAGGRSPRTPQLFSGQKPSGTSSNEARISWKFAGTGPDVTQLNVGFQVSGVTWKQLGPSKVFFDRVDVSSTLLDNKVQLTAGFGTNLLNYIGIFAGGNPILANGVAATIPIETGLSGSTAPTPLLNVTINGQDGLYSKTGLQRSIGPDGLIAEAEDNGIGLQLTRHGAKPLVIEEVGVLRPASADHRQMWLRAGGLYNTTNYVRFDGRGTGKNWMVYALADYQIIQPSKVEAYRGVFVGASALIAPQSVNVYSQTYELRTYAIGMIPGRTTDQMSFTVGYNVFSKTASDVYSLLGAQTHRGQVSVGLLYAYHVTRGMYFSPSVNYIRNPSFTGDFKPAVNLSAGLTIIL